jgi:uncharacterized membrane protein YozB (DUF420 family)
MNVQDLPTLNATLNTCSVLLLTAGFYFIRKGNWKAHAAMMISAVVVSTAFLVSYLIYHARVGHTRANLGMTPLGITYYTILFTHLILAIVMVPMILMVLVRAIRKRWDSHRRLARPTLGIWIYVSVTGVVIYLILYHWLGIKAV